MRLVTAFITSRGAAGKFRCYEPIGGSPQSFFVSLLAERQATGLISGIVGCAGGLGGFFPPLVMGFVRDQYWELRVGFRILAMLAALCWALLLGEEQRFKVQESERPGNQGS